MMKRRKILRFNASLKYIKVDHQWKKYNKTNMKGYIAICHKYDLFDISPLGNDNEALRIDLNFEF